MPYELTEEEKEQEEGAQDNFAIKHVIRRKVSLAYHLHRSTDESAKIRFAGGERGEGTEKVLLHEKRTEREEKVRADCPLSPLDEPKNVTFEAISKTGRGVTSHCKKKHYE